MWFENRNQGYKKGLITLAVACSFTATAAYGQNEPWPGPVPTPGELLGSIPTRFTAYEIILQPDKKASEWWAGAPSVVRDSTGVFWMAARMRSPEYPRGLRGYEIRILRSTDGIHFDPVHRISRDSVPIPGFERPSLLVDPGTGKFKLYACGPWEGGPWSIIKFDDAESPDAVDPSSARPVISPPGKRFERDITVTGYKDPVILFAEGRFHAYVIGYIRQLERIFHFESDDGEVWESVGAPNTSILGLNGWHDFFVRPASVVPVGVGYLFFYEGSNTTWFDPVYNVATGVGFTFDLHNVIDLTPDAPLVVSTTPGPFHTWRYSHWMVVDNRLWVYAEVADADGSNEVRLFRLDM
jgi:hypothetical protein